MNEDNKADQYNVVPDRPPSLDAKGYRAFVIPAAVRGFYRKRRDWFYFFLIMIFLVVPWTTFNGHQTILLDIAHRRFLIFGATFFAHDGPLVFFFFAIAAFTIIFLTAVFGRVWCGWACPQTVFIDFLYRRVEEWVEGNHIARRKLDAAKWNFEKFSKRSLKWFLFFLISAHIAHSFTAYFVGAQKLVWLSLGSPFENWGLFLWVQIFTLVLLADFGWFREQFCLIACPYGRLQSALMDKHSWAILYDYKRGEPRKQKGQKSDFADCIDCLRCVNVCPTGIDIRNGLQMECIACTACADACDEVMDKIGKPTGLIRYTSQAAIEGKKHRLFTVRNAAYMAILLILLTSFTFILSRRPDVDIKLIRAIESPYQIAQNGRLVNHFRAHITNQSSKDLQIQALIFEDPELQLVSPELHKSIAPGESKWIHLFVSFPADSLSGGRYQVEWELKYRAEMEGEKEGRLTLLGPGIL